MKTKLSLLGLVTVLAVVTMLNACGVPPSIYAQWAVSTNGVQSSNAIVALRALGPEGLNALLKTHEGIIAAHRNDDAQWLRVRAALDAVGGQHDCYASHLFWLKDLEAAKTEAQRTGKPILSLRLLGNLDEEMSCANSRFFRTTLYANQEVSDYLRDHFVLHWKSVRPVPRITIDMGDGRKIERTITGNSIHYVLDANGEVVDALPGLYGPRAFLAGLREAEAEAGRLAKREPSTRAFELVNYHSFQLAGINERWASDLARAQLDGGPISSQASQPVAGLGRIQVAAVQPRAVVPAAAAMPLARAKGGVETSMLRSLSPRRAELERSTDDARWAKIAALHQEDALLDANTVALIRAKTMTAQDAMRLALSKRIVEDPMLKTVQNLQRSISEDTVRNEYTFHAKIHEWLATAYTSRNVDALNRRIYAELFLTPDTDPWLGLVPSDTFSALDNGGLTQAAMLPASGKR